MGLVAYALKFRITFYVIAVLVMLAGIGAAVVMPKDVLPEVDIPVITLDAKYDFAGHYDPADLFSTRC
jgi:multidrug efflux pump subunit AcrB